MANGSLNMAFHTVSTWHMNTVNLARVHTHQIMNHQINYQIMSAAHA